MGSSSWLEIAKPTLLADEPSSGIATKVVRPMTCPNALTNAPPELPEEMGASVWTSPFNAFVMSTLVRSSAETMPTVTDGSPSRSSA